MTDEIAFELNGARRVARGGPHRRLVDALRNDFALTATHVGCGLGQCGACHVLIDGRSVAACDTPLWAVAGKSVTTLEGLGSPQKPHPLQAAFIAEQAAQCGFCTSGVIVSAAALLAQEPSPDERAVRAALDRHLCRCGAHNRIVRAVLRAARAMRDADARAAGLQQAAP